MIFKTLFSFLFCFLISFCVNAQFTDYQKADFHLKNEIQNPGAESGKTGWSESGSGTYTADTGTKLRGKASHKFVSAGSGDYLLSPTFTCKNGPNCIVRFWYNTSATSFTATIYEGANQVATLALPTSSWGSPAEMSFVAATPTTSYTVRITDGTAGADTIYADEVFVGRNDSIGSVSQAQFIGSITFGSDCSFSTTSTTFSDLTDATCTTTTEGNISAISGVTTGFTITNVKPGNYFAVYEGGLYRNIADRYGYFRFYDGSSVWGVENVIYTEGEAKIATPGFSGGITYSSGYTSKDVKLQAKVDSGATAVLYNAGTSRKISIYYYPTTSQTVVRAENANGFGSVKWQNVSGCIFTANSGTPTLMSDSDCNTGTVLGNATSGNDNLQFTTYNLKANTIYKVSAGGLFNANTGTTVTNCTFAIYDGTNYIGSSFSSSASGNSSGTGSSLWGYVSYPSNQTSKTFSVYAERNNGDGTCSTFSANDRSMVTLSIEEVYPNQSMPQIINSVGTSYSGTTILNSAYIASSGSISSICTSGACGVYRNTGSWLSSVSRTSLGTYSLSFAPGVFPNAPVCNVTVDGSDLDGQVNVYNISTSGASVSTQNQTGTARVDTRFNITCHGIK